MKRSIKDLPFVESLKFENGRISCAEFTDAITEKTISISAERYIKARDEILSDRSLHFSFLVSIFFKAINLIFWAALLTPFLILTILLFDIYAANPDTTYTIPELSAESIRNTLFVAFQASLGLSIVYRFIMTLLSGPFPSVFKSLLKHRLLMNENILTSPDHYLYGRPNKLHMSLKNVSIL